MSVCPSLVASWNLDLEKRIRTENPVKEKVFFKEHRCLNQVRLLKQVVSPLASNLEVNTEQLQLYISTTVSYVRHW